MDAITMLKNDHKAVKRLFREFEKTENKQKKVALVEKITSELLTHSFIEEQAFYPTTRAEVDDIDDVVLESFEEHHVVKWILAELANLDPSDERYDAKVTVMIENVEHHAEEEETDYFPKVREAMSRKALAELGERMEALKAKAPSSPEQVAEQDKGNVAIGGTSGRFSLSRNKAKTNS